MTHKTHNFDFLSPRERKEATVAFFQAFLKRAFREPWNKQTVSNTIRDLEYPQGWFPLLFPLGLESLVLVFQQRENQNMMKAFKGFPQKSIRKTIIDGLLWRLKQEEQYGNASRNMRHFVMKRPALAWNISWDLAHTLWCIAEPDSNPSFSSFTTKRVLLCGLLATTHMVFFQKRRPSIDEMEGWIRRQVNILVQGMGFAKTFSPLALFSQL